MVKDAQDTEVREESLVLPLSLCTVGSELVWCEISLSFFLCRTKYRTETENSESDSKIHNISTVIVSSGSEVRHGLFLSSDVCTLFGREQ